MNIEWHGQSAFTLRGSERAVLIDPFDQRLRPEGMSIRFDYPQIPQQQVDLLLITHEHFDHNGGPSQTAARTWCAARPEASTALRWAR